MKEDEALGVMMATLILVSILRAANEIAGERDWERLADFSDIDNQYNKNNMTLEQSQKAYTYMHELEDYEAALHLLQMNKGLNVQHSIARLQEEISRVENKIQNL